MYTAHIQETCDALMSKLVCSLNNVMRMINGCPDCLSSEPLTDHLKEILTNESISVKQLLSPLVDSYGSDDPDNSLVRKRCLYINYSKFVERIM